MLCFKAHRAHRLSVRAIYLRNYYRSIAYSMAQLSEQSIYKHFTGYLPSRTSFALVICSPGLRHALVMCFLYLRWFGQAENILCPPLDIHQVASAINEIVRWAYYSHSYVGVRVCEGVRVWVCVCVSYASCCRAVTIRLRPFVSLCSLSFRLLLWLIAIKSAISNHIFTSLTRFQFAI